MRFAGAMELPMQQRWELRTYVEAYMRSERCSGRRRRYLLLRHYVYLVLNWVIYVAAEARLWLVSDRVANLRPKVVVIGSWLATSIGGETAEAGAPTLVVPEATGEEGAGQGELESLLRSLVLDAIPHQFEDERRWGQTKEIPVGLRVSNDGLRIRTKRRKRNCARLPGLPRVQPRRGRRGRAPGRSMERDGGTR
jgi:hypothetical protein